MFKAGRVVRLSDYRHKKPGSGAGLVSYLFLGGAINCGGAGIAVGT